MDCSKCYLPASKSSASHISHDYAHRASLHPSWRSGHSHTVALTWFVACSAVHCKVKWCGRAHTERVGRINLTDALYLLSPASCLQCFTVHKGIALDNAPFVSALIGRNSKTMPMPVCLATLYQTVEIVCSDKIYISSGVSTNTECLLRGHDLVYSRGSNAAL